MCNKLFLFIILICACAANQKVAAQELDARITLNYQQVEGTSTSVFETLKTSLEEFVNERQWTNLQFKRNERISCNFAITVNSYSTSENTFQCTLNVQSTRPIYGSGYTSTCFAFNDANFNFTYQEYDQLEFRSDLIEDNLTAVIAYYIYLIIGFDMDSMSPLGGTEYFQTAQTIVNNAQSLSEKGWKAYDDSKNRHAIITDLLDGGMEPFRQMQYSYYREGLDIMNENAERGRAGVTKALELLGKARENKSMSKVPEIFTEFKRDELVSIYSGHGTSSEKESIVDILSRINPSQNTYWRQMSK